ncbi:MAG: hypothetical protein QOI07_937 [Verrucomicrobiota bacterium]|jgi:hypothetical protein
MANNRPSFGTNQGPHSHSGGVRLYERLQQQILDQTGIAATVIVRPHNVTIRTETYADFVLAKAAIKGGVSVPIEWSKP